MGRGPFGSRLDVSGKKLQTGVIKRALSFAKPYKRFIVLFLIVTVAGSFLGVVPPLLLKTLLDQILRPGAKYFHSFTALNLLALAAIGTALGSAALSLGSRWFSSRVGEGLIFDLRVALFDHVQRMPLAFFTRTHTGALLSRLNNDVVGAQQAVTGTLGSIVSNIISVVSVLIAMFILEWRITLLSLVLLPLFIIPSRRLGDRIQQATRQQMSLNAAMNTTMTEKFNVSGALLVKLFGRPHEEKGEFSGRAGKVRDIGIRIALFSRVFFVVLGLVAAVGTAVVYWVGGRLVFSGAITAGTVASLAAFVAQLYSPLTQLTSARVDLLTAFVSFERVFEVLDKEQAIVDRPGSTDLVSATGRIEFDHAWFRYPRGSDVSIPSLEEGMPSDMNATQDIVLKDVSFTIEPGQTVALVGPSGAGKTTISMLVPRIYDVIDGAVRIDGRDVRELTQQSLRNAVGFVTQDPHMFHDTIANNLRYAAPDASDDQLVEACKAAYIHDLIASLPDRYDTVVGERGYRLSGGEKQRLAIARVFLKNPAIIVLDEATAHLDSESEALIQRALAAALESRTSIVIAHRLSTIVQADEILVVDGGEIVERGRHSELVGARGTYSELYETQFSRATV
ncbi:MAG: ABC transporter ATP-binding protein/permease [Actinobacteria bacterium]|nr:ABC transporter ATP-binding protein/permease [Actinomycetota bacterium]